MLLCLWSVPNPPSPLRWTVQIMSNINRLLWSHNDLMIINVLTQDRAYRSHLSSIVKKAAREAEEKNAGALKSLSQPLSISAALADARSQPRPLRMSVSLLGLVVVMPLVEPRLEFALHPGPPPSTMVGNPKRLWTVGTAEDAARKTNHGLEGVEESSIFQLKGRVPKRMADRQDNAGSGDEKQSEEASTSMSSAIPSTSQSRSRRPGRTPRVFYSGHTVCEGTEHPLLSAWGDVDPDETIDSKNLNILREEIQDCADFLGSDSGSEWGSDSDTDSDEEVSRPARHGRPRAGTVKSREGAYANREGDGRGSNDVAPGRHHAHTHFMLPTSEVAVSAKQQERLHRMKKQSSRRRTQRSARRLLMRLTSFSLSSTSHEFRHHLPAWLDGQAAIGMGHRSVRNETVAGWCSRPMGVVTRCLQEGQRQLLLQRAQLVARYLHGEGIDDGDHMSAISGREGKSGRTRFDLRLAGSSSTALNFIPMLYDAWGDWMPYLQEASRKSGRSGVAGQKTPRIFRYGFANAQAGLLQGTISDWQREEIRILQRQAETQLPLPLLFDTVGDDMSLVVVEFKLGPTTLRTEGGSSLLRPPTTSKPVSQLARSSSPRRHSEPQVHRPDERGPSHPLPPEPVQLQRMDSSKTESSFWQDVSEGSSIEDERSREDHGDDLDSASFQESDSLSDRELNDSGGTEPGRSKRQTEEELVRVHEGAHLLGSTSEDTTTTDQNRRPSLFAKRATEESQPQVPETTSGESGGIEGNDVGISLVQSQFFDGLKLRVESMRMRVMEVTSHHYLPIVEGEHLRKLEDKLREEVLNSLATLDSVREGETVSTSERRAALSTLGVRNEALGRGRRAEIRAIRARKLLGNLAEAPSFLNSVKSVSDAWVKTGTMDAEWWSRRLREVWCTELLSVSSLRANVLRSRLPHLSNLSWPRSAIAAGVGGVSVRFGAPVISPLIALFQAWTDTASNFQKRRLWRSGIEGLLRSLEHKKPSKFSRKTKSKKKKKRSTDRTPKESGTSEAASTAERDSNATKHPGQSRMKIFVGRIGRASLVIEGPGCGPDMLMKSEVVKIVRRLADPLVSAAGQHQEVRESVMDPHDIHFVERRAVRLVETGWLAQIMTMSLHSIGVRAEAASGTMGFAASLNSLALVDDPVLARSSTHGVM